MESIRRKAGMVGSCIVWKREDWFLSDLYVALWIEEAACEGLSE